MSARPNILLMHWHDLGRHLAMYGAAGVESPNLDRMAAEGIRFDRAFTTAPVCSPARGSLFTGAYPHGNGLMGLSNLGWEYAPDARTLPMMLGDSGYRTALIGLQHESWHAERTGFQELHAIGEAITHDFRYCGIVADAAERWIAEAARDRARPFFASVGFWETHRPWPVDRYDPDDPRAVTVPPHLPDNRWSRDDLACFQGSIRVADAAVGRVLAALDEAGLAEDTWVVFTTDHGIAFPGAKASLYEPGLGVSLIMRPPAAWTAAPRGVTDRLHSHVDFVPTVLDVAGVPIPASVQGVSHAAFLTGGAEAPSRDRVFAESNYHDTYDPARSIRTERFKYIRSFEERPRLVLPGDFAWAAVAWGFGSDHLRHRPMEQLFDLETDPLEQHDLGSHANYDAVREELAADLRRWQEETGDPLLTGPIVAPPMPRLALLGALPD